jgi:WD40 repeat protein
MPASSRAIQHSSILAPWVLWLAPDQPAGATVAIGSSDDSVRLSDVASQGQVGDPFTGHTADVTSVAFSPDGQTLASSGRGCG